MTIKALRSRRASSVCGLTLAAIAAATLGVRAQARPEPNRGGDLDLVSQDPRIALERLQVADGYAVNLFASEQEFPELAKPLAMTFDAKGRLWVLTSPTYPHSLPGVRPDDKLLILSDTNTDGRADKMTVFADRLHMPMGFELGDGGVYVSQQTELMFLRDTDDDDRADQRRIVLHGFGTEDSHHNIHTFTWDNGGGLHFQEGTFLHSQVETPYGPVRVEYASVFRYEPRTEKFGVFVTYPFANPWGHVIDGWGQNFVSDASNGNNYFGTAFSGNVTYPAKQKPMKTWVPTTVRPTAGIELVSSRHFPESAQGDFLLTNVIGFLGIKQFKGRDEGSGFAGVETEPLLRSTDPNFRPVAMQFGPDGALYVVDWFNPLIGHMQYSLRDARRDASRGRVWRITAKGRPLNPRPAIDGQPIAAQLELLKAYEDRTRYRVRRALRDRPTPEVLAALEKWTAGLDAADAGYEHNLLEALWVYQHHDVVKVELLEKLLAAKDFRARAAAIRVVQVQFDRVERGMTYLQAAVKDPAPRVRLEAVRALSYVPTAQAASTALEVLRLPMDYSLNYALDSAMTTLEPAWQPMLRTERSDIEANPAGLAYVLGRLDSAGLAALPRSKPVFDALLTRTGIEPVHREQAVEGLARLNGTDRVGELVAAIDRVDGIPGGAPVTRDLAALLAGSDAAALKAVRPALERLATHGKSDVAREAGFAALVRGDGEPRAAWTVASASPRRRIDFVNATLLLPDPASQDQIYPLVAGLLAPAETGRPRQAEPPVTGRYVRVVSPGRDRAVRLTEVQVFSGGENMAPKGSASQSSNVPGVGGVAGLAIDGGIEATSGAASVAFTGQDQDPWWEVDLGEMRPIETIAIWNAGGGQERGATLHVSVLDGSRTPVFTRDGVATATPTETIAIGGDLSARTTIAAMTALAAMRGHEADTFALLSGFVKSGATRYAAIAAIRQLPKASWPQAQIAPLADELVAYARTVPHANRSGDVFRQVIDLGRDLASRLPGGDGQRVGAAFNALVLRTIRIEAVKAQMKFDVRTVRLLAGEEVDIEFVNADEMPHNLLITAAGALETVSLKAEAMVKEPDAFAKSFIPDSKDVLFSTPLVAPGETIRKRFVAPAQPDGYPFVCTFPGHWRTMNGTVEVARAPASSSAP